MKFLNGTFLVIHTGLDFLRIFIFAQQPLNRKPVHNKLYNPALAPH